jgi:hypothetical protein
VTKLLWLCPDTDTALTLLGFFKFERLEERIYEFETLRRGSGKERMPDGKLHADSLRRSSTRSSKRKAAFCALCSEPGSVGGLVVDRNDLRKKGGGLLHLECKAFLALGRDDPLRFQRASDHLIAVPCGFGHHPNGSQRPCDVSSQCSLRCRLCCQNGTLVDLDRRRCERLGLFELSVEIPRPNAAYRRGGEECLRPPSRCEVSRAQVRGRTRRFCDEARNRTEYRHRFRRPCPGAYKARI